MKCRCLIADDEPLAVRLLESYCRRIDGVELVGSHTSAAEALEVLRDGGVDVAVLDIQMPQMTGIEIARAIEGLPTEIIFVTAYRDYALEGFKVHAADYLLKPVSFEDFSAALGRVMGRLAPERPGFIIVRSDYRQVRIELDDILHVEGLKDYVKIFTASRERPVVTLMNLKSIESMLPEDRFVRVHRSYIVSMGRIDGFDRGAVRVGSTEVPIGDTYRARFVERFKNQSIN